MSIEVKLQGPIYSLELSNGPPQLPPDPKDCWIVVYADIGQEGSRGADTFTFYVCTLKKLVTIVRKKRYELQRHLLIVERFDWGLVESAILSICERATGETWDEVATQIGRYGHWEFEDYQENPPPAPKGNGPGKPGKPVPVLPIVREISSIDLSNGPPQLPPDPEDCWIVVQADIGQVDGEEKKTFTFYVCTPKKLSTIVTHEYKWGLYLIIIERFDWKIVEQAIASICKEVAGETWGEVVTMLVRYGQAEIADLKG